MSASLMATPLVATKLHVPNLRSRVVERPRLRELLDRGGDARLTLISAPAGFGKTTLLAEWLARAPSEGRAVAWLSLDETDSEPSLFWPHVVAALQGAFERAGGEFPDLPGATSPDDAFIAILLNQLTTADRAVVLVLDDFHLVEHADIHARLAFFVEHLPPQVHVVISTRADPALPLSRLRARRDLVEVRAADLRMTTDETSAYLNDIMGLSLSRADTAALEERTEGWVAALQLAVISLEGRSDPSAFIEGFAGSGRYIVDYLVEEVLQRLPEDLRQFLLRTCVLRRLTASLCDAVTGETGAARGIIDRLERQNLFLVPLDDQRQWYRYHHLFADVLRSHLNVDQQQDLASIHRRASEWFESNGERAEAIHHALASQDFEWAAELLERMVPEMRRTRQERVFRAWMKVIPDAIVRARPRLGLGYVGVLASLGEFDGVEDRIDWAEERLDGLDPTGALRAGAELYRSALAQVRGELDVAARHAKRVLELAPPDDHLVRAGAAGFLGIVSWSQGNLEMAASFWTQCRDGLRHAGHIADVQGTTIALADILTAQGRLTEALRACQDALDLATTGGRAAVRGVADNHASMSVLHLERDEPDAAAAHLAKALELGDLFGLPQHPYRSRVAQARADLVRGRSTMALRQLREAERLYVSDFFPNVRPIPAMVARVQIKLGQLDEAGRWVAVAKVDAAEPLSYAREYEHITLARLLLALAPSEPKALAQARQLLARLRAAAQEGNRKTSLVEILILEALGARLAGDNASALDALRQAFDLAALEGHARPFLDEGEALAALLKLAAKRDIAPAFVRRLLAAEPSEASPVASEHPDLIEALSEREVDVLRLLRSDLSGPDIARELAVSLNTFRTHTKNIFEKLGVNSRRAAVRRAEEMQLFGRGNAR
jgi:LuxR family maltose regulon positive regulatory protein